MLLQRLGKLPKLKGLSPGKQRIKAAEAINARAGGGNVTAAPSFGKYSDTLGVKPLNDSGQSFSASHKSSPASPKRRDTSATDNNVSGPSAGDTRTPSLDWRKAASSGGFGGNSPIARPDFSNQHKYSGINNSPDLQSLVARRMGGDVDNDFRDDKNQLGLSTIGNIIGKKNGKALGGDIGDFPNDRNNRSLATIITEDWIKRKPKPKKDGGNIGVNGDPNDRGGWFRSSKTNPFLGGVGKTIDRTPPPSPPKKKSTRTLADLIDTLMN